MFHSTFGSGSVAEVEGEMVTIAIDFDRAERKRVLDGFVTPTG